MDTFRQVATTVLVLLVVAAVWVAFLTATMWILKKVFRKPVLWVYRQKWTQQLLSSSQQRVRTFWEHNREQLGDTWQFLSEIIIDPLFFAYVLFILFNRLDAITNFTKANPQYNFFQVLNADMEQDKTLYFLFVTIFTLWMWGKAYAHRQHRKEQRSIMKALTANTEAIIANSKIIQAVSRKLGVVIDDDVDKGSGI